METNEVIHHRKKKKNNIWFYISIGLAIALILSLTLGNSSSNPDEVTTDTLDYINNYLIDGDTAILLESGEVSGIYSLKLDIGGQTFDSYVTTDGTLLFSSAIDLTEIPTTETTSPTVETIVDVSIDDDAILGDEDALVTIVEFSDFECPYCARFYSDTMGQIVSEYIDTGLVNLVFRDFPLSFHANAQKAAEATECAEEQDQFWEMHDTIFENQAAITVDDLKQYASDLGLDTEAFNECLDSDKYYDEVQNDFQEGQSYGVSGTPAFFINGRELVGAQPFSAFQEIIEEELNS